MRVVGIFAVLAIFATGATAIAHAFLDHAVPPVGASLAASPAEARLWFSEKLELAFSRISVFDGHDSRVDRGDSSIDPGDGTQLRVSLPPLPPGSYKVVWRAVSVDTHVTEGNYRFNIKGE